MKNNLCRSIVMQVYVSLLLCVLITPAQRSKPVSPAANPKTSPVVSKTANNDIKQKFALVVGNNNYWELPLENPKNDAALMGSTLRKLGFKVTEKYDLRVSEMNKAIDDFIAQIPPNSVALFFYAGHGVQVSGKNFLLPVDYEPVVNEGDLMVKSIDVDGAISRISAKSTVSLFVLDACRNNNDKLKIPFVTEDGFAEIRQDSAGAYIAYATSPGKTAEDGLGNSSNSPYTEALARNLLLRPGRLEDVFIRTRIDVENATRSSQMPWEKSALKTVFYFTPDPLASTVTSAPPVASLKPKLPSGIKALTPFTFNSPLLDASGIRTSILNGNGSLFREEVSGVNLEMAEIKGGEFQMGTGGAEADKVFSDAKKYGGDVSREVLAAEMPEHRVKVPGFFISRREITQAQWQAVMGRLPGIPPNFLGADRPVVNVTWDDANEFCERLAQATGRNYRLPSEAQWEYAASGGKETPFGLGENINSTLVNYFGGAPFGSGKRGTFRDALLSAGELGAPNPFGLFDMHGNAWEWVADNWNDSYNGAPTDGSAWNETDPDNEPYRVIRGGAYDSIGIDCRSSHRRKQPGVEYSSMSIGFRVVVD